MFIKFKDTAIVDDVTKNLVNALNELEEVWDSEDGAISADVVTDEDLYDESDDDTDDGVSTCTVLVEIPNADMSLMLVQDEDDEDVWYVARCNYTDDDPRAIDTKYEIDSSSAVI